MSNNTPCYECKVAPGERHHRGCDVEACPYCGGQFISCCCDASTDGVPDDDRMVWTGVWPGEAECHEFGWFQSGTDQDGQQLPDLNRLRRDARWDRHQQRWVKKETLAEAPRRE